MIQMLWMELGLEREMVLVNFDIGEHELEAEATNHVDDDLRNEALFNGSEELTKSVLPV